MTDFRAKRPVIVPGKAIHPVANAKPVQPSGREQRRGKRVNSRVPVAVEWRAGNDLLRNEAQTRVVGPYGCMLVLPTNLEVKQAIQLTNMMSQQSNAAVIVWRGAQRAEGWELGIELISPQMDFWGLEL